MVYKNADDEDGKDDRAIRGFQFVPLRGETALIAAGDYPGQTHHLNPWAMFAVAVAGAVIGDNIGYRMGDKGVYRLARRYGCKVRLDEAKLKVGRYVFDRHGAKDVSGKIDLEAGRVTSPLGEGHRQVVDPHKIPTILSTSFPGRLRRARERAPQS